MCRKINAGIAYANINKFRWYAEEAMARQIKLNERKSATSLSGRGLQFWSTHILDRASRNRQNTDREARKINRAD